MYNTERSSLTITQIQKSIIIGSLLGDGCIEKNALDCCFSEQHTQYQYDYLVWKAKMLDTPVYTINRNFGLVFRIRFPSNIYWTQFRQEWYPNGIKIVPKSVLTNLDELALTVWYLDDGDKMNDQNPNNQLNAGRISTAGFTYKDNLLLIRALQKNFGITVKLLKEKNNKRNKSYYRLYFGSRTGAFDKLMNIVKRQFELYQIPDCMRYKLGERVETRQGKTPISQKNITRNIDGKFESLRYSPNN